MRSSTNSDISNIYKIMTSSKFGKNKYISCLSIFILSLIIIGVIIPEIIERNQVLRNREGGFVVREDLKISSSLRKQFIIIGGAGAFKQISELNNSIEDGIISIPIPNGPVEFITSECSAWRHIISENKKKGYLLLCQAEICESHHVYSNAELFNIHNRKEIRLPISFGNFIGAGLLKGPLLSGVVISSTCSGNYSIKLFNSQGAGKAFSISLPDDYISLACGSRSFIISTHNEMRWFDSDGYDNSRFQISGHVIYDEVNKRYAVLKEEKTWSLWFPYRYRIHFFNESDINNDSYQAAKFLISTSSEILSSCFDVTGNFIFYSVRNVGKGPSEIWILNLKSKKYQRFFDCNGVSPSCGIGTVPPFEPISEEIL